MARVKYYDHQSEQWKYADTALGIKGDPGKTPEKGVDYFTEEDKQEMIGRLIDEGVLTYNEQELTEEQKAQARENIGAAVPSDVTNAKTMAINESKTYTDSQVKKAAPRNLLDNSDFRNPVNQRGGNNLDRWILANSAFSGYTLLSFQSDGIAITNDAGADQVCLFQRFIDKNFDGKTYTAYVMTSDGLYSGYVETIKEDEGIRQCNFWIPTGSKIIWAALYEGEYTAETLPKYQPKGYGAELAECRRYYKEFKCVKDSFELLLSGYITSDAKIILVSVPFGMRAGGVPTVTFEGAITIRGVDGYLQSSSGGYSDISMKAYGTDGESVKGNIAIAKSDSTAFSGATNNTPVMVNFRPGATLTLSRDL